MASLDTFLIVMFHLTISILRAESIFNKIKCSVYNVTSCFSFHVSAFFAGMINYLQVLDKITTITF